MLKKLLFEKNIQQGGFDNLADEEFEIFRALSLNVNNILEDFQVLINVLLKKINKKC